MRRKRMGRKANKRNFRRGSTPKRKNYRSKPMRGGWRL